MSILTKWLTRLPDPKELMDKINEIIKSVNSLHQRLEKLGDATIKLAECIDVLERELLPQDTLMNPKFRTRTTLIREILAPQ